MTTGGTRVRGRQAATVLGLVALAASALYGGDFLGMRTRVSGVELPPARPPALSTALDGQSAVAATGAAPTRVRSYPWWQQVRSGEGTGAATWTLPIHEHALQWRVWWSCDSGELSVQASTLEQPLVEADCPGEDVAYATRTGVTRLETRGQGSWQLRVEQQVDVPLEEPPLPTMTVPSAAVVAEGGFYDIDQTGRGQVRVHRLADGSHALRLEEFFVTPNVDLEVRLSPLEAPASTEEFLSAPSVLVAGLQATAGSMNFAVPEGIDPTQFASAVIWCPPLRTAYAAATLTTLP